MLDQSTNTTQLNLFLMHKIALQASWRSVKMLFAPPSLKYWKTLTSILPLYLLFFVGDYGII